MRKSTLKLVIRRETLRVLAEVQLVHAIGGGTGARPLDTGDAPTGCQLPIGVDTESPVTGCQVVSVKG